MAPRPAMIVMWWVTGKLRPRLRNSSDTADRPKISRLATQRDREELGEP